MDIDDKRTGRVTVLKEVTLQREGGWHLCLQRARYVYDNGDLEEGFRFIWRKPDGKMHGARGQARIPSLSTARILMAKAEEAGWGKFEAEDTRLFIPR